MTNLQLADVTRVTALPAVVDDFFALQHKKLQDCVEQIVEGM